MLLKFDLCAALLLLSLEGPTQAHDIYSDLTDRNGVSCCDQYHCRPANYRVMPTGVQMFVYGEWIDVPEDKIQYQAVPGDTGETGGGHWCGRPRDWQSPRVLLTVCAILPPNDARIVQPPYSE
jgi:hypothetical protein